MAPPCVQGFGLQMDPTQAGTPAFQKALMAVLTDPRYARAAKAMSVKIRARKNTPVQEAAGVPACSQSRIVHCGAVAAIALCVSM